MNVLNPVTIHILQLECREGYNVKTGCVCAVPCASSSYRD